MAAAVQDRSVTHVRLDRQFAFQELEYDAPENYMPCIKLSFFFNKLPDVSYDHFHKHYAHVHADLAVAARIFGAFEVKRYTQFHQTPEDKEKLKDIGLSLLDYDGCSTLWFKNWDDAKRFLTHEEYASLFDDTKNFMDTSNGIKVMAGQELLVFGKATPEIDAKDGITERQS